MKKIHEKLKRGIPQEYSSSYKQATRQAKKLLLLKQKKKTLFILMKSSYPTHHNNKIEEQNKTTLFAYHTLSWKNITHTLTYTHTCAYVYYLTYFVLRLNSSACL